MTGRKKWLIAIDPGLVTLGYAVFDADSYKEKGVGDSVTTFGVYSPSPKSAPSARAKFFRDVFLTLRSRYSPSLEVVCERQFYSPFMRPALIDSIAAVQEIVGGLRFMFADYPVHLVEPRVWQGRMMPRLKRQKGASKERSLEEANKLLRASSWEKDASWGGFKRNHHVTDAILIGVWWLSWGREV